MASQYAWSMLNVQTSPREPALAEAEGDKPTQQMAQTKNKQNKQ